jgi:hypothetical protein
MRLRREVDDRIAPFHRTRDHLRIADIPLDEVKPGEAFDCAEILEIPCIGECVENGDLEPLSIEE